MKLIKTFDKSYLSIGLSKFAQTVVVRFLKSPSIHPIYINAWGSFSFNDINVNIQSKMRLFADDSVINRDIHCEKDHSTLHQNLHTLADWSSKWLMEFNIQKCYTLTITRTRKPSIHQYELLDEAIHRVDEYKYLRIIVSKDLRWTANFQAILHKANKTLGLLRRTLSPCSKEINTRAYQDLLRPQLVYGSEAWNPCAYHCSTKARESPKSNCSVCTPRLQARHIGHSINFQTGLGPSSHPKTSRTMHHVLQSSQQLCVNIPVPPFIIPAP